MNCRIEHRKMVFKRPSGTSRGVLNSKNSWFIILEDGGSIGVGECSVIEGLSTDIENGLAEKMEAIRLDINKSQTFTLGDDFFIGVPALRFAYEMALKDLKEGSQKRIFNSGFLDGKGIPINGLVWMGEKEFMYDQIKTKIKEGYSCIKIKIAAIDFQEELRLIKYIRTQFSPKEMQIRVDANGGFSNKEALERIKCLSDFELHSIEQPIKQGQPTVMAELCENTPLPIVLDEELIGYEKREEKEALLRIIKPQYIILKPSLIGGFHASQEWIDLADNNGIGWWITSALEANIGLNAIAQWTSTLNSDMYQGLGTGQLFTNNIPSPLYIEQGHLYHGDRSWGEI